jgi:anhydro-N-acetylmuramic acid kinase
MQSMRVIGMISGTSADGIDAALVEIEGAPPAIQVRLVKHMTVSFAPALRDELLACFRPETSSVDRLSRLNTALGSAFADAAQTMIAATGHTSEQIDLIGSHGQTLWYDPPVKENGTTKLGTLLTLGEPAIIVERTGVTTISHFRENDLAAGGFGAPLVSYLDWLLFRDPIQTRATQNIGGIGNVTYLPPLNTDEPPITFDTGPGNMLIDYCAGRASDGKLSYDRDGIMAAQGVVNREWLAELMAHPYLQAAPPKATGRELFGAQMGVLLWEQGVTLGMKPVDIVATVTAFTAESIATAYRKWLPRPVDALYVAGGGSKNPTLVGMLRARVGSRTQVKDHSELGIPGDAKESVLFALLAYETWHHRPGALPVLTGASRGTVMGRVTFGRC